MKDFAESQKAKQNFQFKLCLRFQPIIFISDNANMILGKNMGHIISRHECFLTFCVLSCKLFRRGFACHVSFLEEFRQKYGPAGFSMSLPYILSTDSKTVLS